MESRKKVDIKILKELTEFENSYFNENLLVGNLKDIIPDEKEIK